MHMHTVNVASDQSEGASDQMHMHTVNVASDQIGGV